MRWRRSHPRAGEGPRKRQAGGGGDHENAAFQSVPTSFIASDRSVRRYFTSTSVFQFTPANFTAGDCGGPGQRCGQAQVSIHARQFHSGRRRQLRRYVARASVSIHARQFHSGRRLQNNRAAVGDAFQSTPANFTAGDLLRRQAQHDRHRVSIHAHQFHGGRRLVSDAIVSRAAFQSTPTNFMAGDSSRS